MFVVNVDVLEVDRSGLGVGNEADEVEVVGGGEASLIVLSSSHIFDSRRQDKIASDGDIPSRLSDT